ncbi:bifunctional homocysteine S-methyltransferase/methylenetetrahydrofolate reductase [Lacrimispora sp.]|uniref:bifunctional homocysteine S-methyltransferase/methylenetetrahydrofolate reductase n=1 Tax=Lacrimispora sp. TaxID=2719234 RepID=UPI002FDADBC7
MKIQEYLKKYNIIADGAFGTYYAEKYQTQEMPEFANTAHGDRVREIHGEYLKAGATLIRTNTFASNTVVLQKSWVDVETNIKESVKLAQEAVRQNSDIRDDVFIAGDIGPIPIDEGVDFEELEQEYYGIAKVFAENGVSILNFETFPDMEHILPAIRKIKEEYEMFIMVSFSVNQFGYSASGLGAKRLLSDASKVNCIDGAGLNCGVGPGHMYTIMERLELPENLYIMALPNAGYPTLSRNQLQFGNTPSYFAEKMKNLTVLGVDIVGGCCGTNPGFIKEMSEDRDTAVKKVKLSPEEKQQKQKKMIRKGFLYDENGERKKKKFIAVELAPPFNADDEKLLEAAHILKNADVDVLTFPDSPSGRTRVDSVLMSEKVRRATGLEVMPHICCRDKNAVAIRSLFMGARINDINNMLIITGDPLPSATRQTVKAVFNFDSVGLMKIVREMNEEIFAEQPLSYGGAINQGRRNLEVEIERVKKKMEAGAEFFLTQPVFTEEDVKRLRYMKEKTGATIFCGIMPLVNRKNALFMKNEIAGVNVTEEIVNRYPEHGTKEEGEAVGVALAKEVIAMMEDFADGYYFTFPFNRVYLLPQIVSRESSDSSGA